MDKNSNVEIPKWLKEMPVAPEFRPTDTEFADPIAYISKIEKEAGAFGICKVIPPLPKPSKRYVFNNLNNSLLKSGEVPVSLNYTDGGDDSSKRDSGSRGNDAEAKAVFTTRQQELGQPPKKSRVLGFGPQVLAQKQVWQSGEVYTLEQFESKSKAFSRSVLSSVKNITPQVIESMFWKATSEKPIYVEYANDVPGSGFGEPEVSLRYFPARKKRRRREFARNHEVKSYCMQQDAKTVGIEPEVLSQSSYLISEPSNPCGSQSTSSSYATSELTKQGAVSPSAELEGTAGWMLSNSPWNLQVIARSAGSLTRFMLDDIPGVTSPMVYIGMLFSWFAWHIEDHELHSLNFLHIGAPKTWYAVPGDYAFAFEEVIRKQAYGDVDHLAALKLLGEKTTLLSPESVIASGIPCCRLVQNPGEFVVTFPRAYHVGFSHGFNCGEAANLGTPQWLSVAKDAAARRAAMDQLPMLSHQQLLYLLTMSFFSRVPKSLFTGVRSSRFKDRLKIERELLVKKAFIEDVLKENTLLNTLLGKDSAYRAVLWHPDSLPSFTRESLSQTGIALEKSNKNGDQDHLIQHLTSDAVTANDFYLDGDDISCDFQVDSGTLPCVACGILGYPLMSVAQPSEKASLEFCPADFFTKAREAEVLQRPTPYDHQHPSMNAISATNTAERQGSSGFLTPRIFCLEHAVQVEELLRYKGGAKMLIICHADFQKIKANAVAIAEEIGAAFNFKEVPLDSASKQELNLIDLAIDSEQLTDCQEDWTSKLGVNLRYVVKARSSCPSMKIGHGLNLDYLLSVIAPGSVISRIKWCSRKSRTKRDPNYRKFEKACDAKAAKPLRKDEAIHVSDGGMEVKEKVLQYSRRKYRTKSRTFTEQKCAPTTDENCVKVEASEQETSGATLVNNMLADYTERSAVPQHDEADMAKENRKREGDRVNSQSLEATVLTEAFASDDPISQGKTCVDEKTRKENEISGVQNCCNLPDGGSSSCISEVQVVNETYKHDLILTCSASTSGIEIDTDLSASRKQNHKGSQKVTSENKRRRAREEVLSQTELHNDFVRSPCEGLRPRKKELCATTMSKIQKPPRKKFKMDDKICSSYKCHLEGCTMCFKTRAELLLHRNKRCHYEGCGKRFRSHKYLVLHQRLHNFDRPLKCTWNGCSMTFKWAWARTEHLRLHTGERPYQCQIKGCGLTFRYVSDFSRHRRKNRHYVNSST